MNEWEYHFQPHILMRGWDYANSGKVTDLKKTEDSISAVVSGNEFYKVEIRLDGGVVTDAFCTCPYAVDGSWCKHMAAVLYSVDPEVMEQGDYHITPIEEIVRAADRKQLENLLIDYAYNNKRIDSEIRSLLDKNDRKSVVYIENEIDKIFYAYSDRHGFIDWHNASDFQSTLEIMLETEVGVLIDKGQFMDAFKTSMHAFVKLGNWDIDDDGEIASISRTCYELWMRIISDCSQEERDAIKTWFEEHSCDGTVIDYMEDTLQDFLKYELISDEELREQISDLESLVEGSKGRNECTSVFSSYYGYRVEAIELRNIFARRLGATDEEIDSYMRRYMSFRSVRMHFIKKARELGDTAEEIRLLQACKKYDANSIYSLRKYYERLIELYRAANDTVSEKRELREYILADEGTSIEEYRIYRQLCSDEEWKNERLTIIRSRKNIEKKCDLLAEEKMYGKLFELIWGQKEKLHLVDKYGFLLADEHSEQILGFYSEVTSKLAERACNRARYNELIRYLKRMSQYPGGEKRAKVLCGEWMDLYPTRKVMVEELREFYYSSSW